MGVPWGPASAPLSHSRLWDSGASSPPGSPLRGSGLATFWGRLRCLPRSGPGQHCVWVGGGWFWIKMSLQNIKNETKPRESVRWSRDQSAWVQSKHVFSDRRIRQHTLGTGRGRDAGPGRPAGTRVRPAPRGACVAGLPEGGSPPQPPRGSDASPEQLPLWLPRGHRRPRGRTWLGQVFIQVEKTLGCSGETGLAVEEYSGEIVLLVLLFLHFQGYTFVLIFASKYI